MLRTLGYQLRSLVSLMTMQSLFYAIPATIVGLILMVFALQGLKATIYSYTQFSIYT